MDIRSILLFNHPDHELQKLINNCTVRKKDLVKLATDCQSKLSIYQQIMQQKESLLLQYEQLRHKYENLSTGLFESIQKEYQQEKCHTQHQSEQKNEILPKRSHPQRHHNHHNQQTKPIRKVEKRRK